MVQSMNYAMEIPKRVVFKLKKALKVRNKFYMPGKSTT